MAQGNKLSDAEKTCFVFVETYDEHWIQCKNWSHEDCARLIDGAFYFSDTRVNEYVSCAKLNIWERP
jgi:hypothetical protein